MYKNLRWKLIITALVTALGIAARARAEQRFSPVGFAEGLDRLHREAIRRSGVAA